MHCSRSTVVVSVLLLLHGFTLFEIGSSSSSQRNLVTVNWTLEGLQEINHSIDVRINELLVFLCNGYSNVITVDQNQFQSCNASGSDFVVRRGTCDQVDTMIAFNVRSQPANLKSLINFIPGRTLYFTSFSTGQSFGDAYSTNFVGGECLDGVKLEVHVLSDTVTTEPTTVAPTTEKEDNSEPSKVSSVTSGKDSNIHNPDKDENPVVVNEPKAANLVSGSTWLHSAPSVLCTLVLAACALIR